MKVPVIDVQHHPYIEPNPQKTLEDHIEFMDNFGINMAIVSNQLPQPNDGNASMYERMNDKLIELSNSYPDRFVACPSIPIHNVKAAMHELERLSSRTNVKAALIRPINGRIDTEPFDDFYESVCASDVPLLVHPIFRDATYDTLFGDKYKLGASIGFMMDTTIAVSWLIFSGLLERFPKLKLLSHHLGGATPFLLGRLEAVYDESGSKIPKRPTDYFKMLYFDTVCYAQEPLELTYKIVGPDHLLFGTDFGCPAKGLVAPQKFLSIINNLKIQPEEREKILGGNALRLFDLKQPKLEDAEKLRIPRKRMNK